MNAIANVAPTNTVPMTAEEFSRSHENNRAELVNGVVEELPMPRNKHGYICNLLAFFLTEFVRKNDRGRIMSNDSFIQTRTNPDTIRGPDISYFSYDRMPKGHVPDGLSPHIPDLVVEVVSPTNTFDEIHIKNEEYFQAGVRLVWVVSTRMRFIQVYTDAGQFYQLGMNDTLTGDPVLPGFTLPLKNLFSKRYS